MQKEVFEIVTNVVLNETFERTEDLVKLAGKIAMWAAENTHNNDELKLREKTFALAGALADWAMAFEEPTDA